MVSIFNTKLFGKCQSMGQVVKRHLKQTLQKNLMLVQKNLGKAATEFISHRLTQMNTREYYKCICKYYN